MESDVLRELYEKYHQKAYLYVLSLCRDRETAEDIVSEGFEKAFLTVEGCPEGFFWWLLRVCRNFWLDTLRKQKRQGGEIPEEIPKKRQIPLRDLTVLRLPGIAFTLPARRISNSSATPRELSSTPCRKRFVPKRRS